MKKQILPKFKKKSKKVIFYVYLIIGFIISTIVILSLGYLSNNNNYIYPFLLWEIVGSLVMGTIYQITVKLDLIEDTDRVIYGITGFIFSFIFVIPFIFILNKFSFIYRRIIKYLDKLDEK